MRKLLQIITLTIFLGCSNNGGQMNNGQTIPDTPISFTFPDSLFIYTNITNSYLTNKFSWDDKIIGRIFTDSTKKTAYVKLDTNQMRKLISPVLTIDPNYVTEYMEGHFISRQNKIYDFTPIIVFVNGDDFGELLYILLDKNNKPISHFVLYGTDCGGGQWEYNDTLLTYCPEKHCSSIDDKKIITYTLDFYDKKEWFEKPDSIIRPSFVDSVTFETFIKSDGTFETNKIDSIRYTRQRWTE